MTKMFAKPTTRSSLNERPARPPKAKQSRATARDKYSFKEACRHLVGGVNSPVRAFKAVGGEPFFVSRARGSKIFDSRGKAYLDYVMSWGPHILGHGHPAVIRALKKAVECGTSFGAPTWQEVELACLVKEAFPSIDKVRFVSSGTEAVMSAVRVARGFTGRKKIVKFNGCYHGHSDALLVKAGSGSATFGIPDSKGVPEELAGLTVSLPYNQTEPVEKLFRQEANQIACLLVEPVAGNMGLVPPAEGFLKTLREICTRYRVALIFDEVISGFRAAFGGAQELFGVKPDLTCLGKILGGGLPLGAFGGREEIMNRLSPEGDVYQAGTLSGNPLATACGIAMLTKLRSGKIYKDLKKKTSSLVEPLRNFARQKKYPIQINVSGSLFTVFFTPEPVCDYQSAKSSDTARYARFFNFLLKNGIFFPPSQFECCFVSAAHNPADIRKTLDIARKALQEIF